MAAGKGTRFLPLTEKIPKALIPVLGKPLVEYTLDVCIPHVSEIIFVVNDMLGFKIIEYFGYQYKNIPISYVTQKESDPSGTFSALLCAKSLIDNDIFAVCNCDDLYKKEDIDNAFIKNHCGLGLTISSMPWVYHGIDTKDGFIKGLRRHKKNKSLVMDKFANGFYLLPKEVLNFSPVSLNNGELGLPHTLLSNLDIVPLKELPFSDWVAVDCPKNIKKAEEFIKKNRL